jgi:hypothetical protein
MGSLLKFLATVLILGGSLGAVTTLAERPGARFMPMRYLLGVGLVAASWWLSRP